MSDLLAVLLVVWVVGVAASLVIGLMLLSDAQDSAKFEHAREQSVCDRRTGLRLVLGGCFVWPVLAARKSLSLVRGALEDERRARRG